MANKSHIVSAFDNDLLDVQVKLSEMGGLAEEMLASCMDALERRDIALSDEIVRRDKQLDRLEAELEELVTRVMALRQPMAQDLRLLLAALKLATVLERIGDLSKNIARRARELSRGKPTRLTGSVVRMGRATQRQVSDVLDAFTSRDSQLAERVWRGDVEIDEHYNSLFRELITYMMEDPKTISLGSQYLFIAKNLERIGDHATHIAEVAYYVVEGESLGDDRPRGEPIGLGGADADETSGAEDEDGDEA